MKIIWLVEKFGYDIKVQAVAGGLPFTVVEERHGLYLWIQYDDGRTGYVDKISNVMYHLYRGLPNQHNKENELCAK